MSHKVAKINSLVGEKEKSHAHGKSLYWRSSPVETSGYPCFTSLLISTASVNQSQIREKKGGEEKEIKNRDKEGRLVSTYVTLITKKKRRKKSYGSRKVKNLDIKGEYKIVRRKKGPKKKKKKTATRISLGNSKPKTNSRKKKKVIDMAGSRSAERPETAQKSWKRGKGKVQKQRNGGGRNRQTE